MTWDEDAAKPARPAIAVGEPLGNLSIAELEARILALTREIDRVRRGAARQAWPRSCRRCGL